MKLTVCCRWYWLECTLHKNYMRKKPTLSLTASTLNHIRHGCLSILFAQRLWLTCSDNLNNFRTNQKHNNNKQCTFLVHTIWEERDSNLISLNYNGRNRKVQMTTNVVNYSKQYSTYRRRVSLKWILFSQDWIFYTSKSFQ